MGIETELEQFKEQDPSMLSEEVKKYISEIEQNLEDFKKRREEEQQSILEGLLRKTEYLIIEEDATTAVAAIRTKLEEFRQNQKQMSDQMKESITKIEQGLAEFKAQERLKTLCDLISKVEYHVLNPEDNLEEIAADIQTILESFREYQDKLSEETRKCISDVEQQFKHLQPMIELFRLKTQIQSINSKIAGGSHDTFAEELEEIRTKLKDCGDNDSVEENSSLRKKIIGQLRGSIKYQMGLVEDSHERSILEQSREKIREQKRRWFGKIALLLAMCFLGPKLWKKYNDFMYPKTSWWGMLKFW